MFRETYGFMPSTMNAYAAHTKTPYLKAPPPTPVNPWSFYMQANGGISDRQATVASSGFKLDSVGGTIGTEYRINNNAFVGDAFDYSNPKARLFNNAGATDLNSYQLGIYGAWADAHFFAQGLRLAELSQHAPRRGRHHHFKVGRKHRPRGRKVRLPVRRREVPGRPDRWPDLRSTEGSSTHISI
jgi:hypothetical protein